jgi:fucose permease
VTYTYKHTLYACYLGYITQAIVNNLAPLLFVIFQDQFGISFEMIGRLILLNFGMQIVVDALAARYVDRIGYRTAAVAAHLFSAAGLVGLSVLPRLMPSPYVGLSMAVVIYAIGGGLIEVLISPIVQSLPGDAKASAMSLLHSFYCWGQMGVVLVTTILIRAFGAGIWYVLPLLWALVPLYNLVRFVQVPLMPPLADGQQLSFRQLLTSNAFVIALILMMCAGSSELTMSQWSSLFAEKGLRVSKLMGDLMGPCLFAVFMGVGRTIYGVWGHKIHLEKALMASGALCVACYALTVFSRNPLLGLLGCAVCGFSVSLMWPGTLSLTADTYPRGGTAMFGLLAIFGDVGGSVGPWMAGVVSDVAQRSSGLAALGAANNWNMEQLGLKVGLLIAMIFPLILFAGIILLRRARARLAQDADQAALPVIGAG